MCLRKCSADQSKGKVAGRTHTDQGCMWEAAVRQQGLAREQVTLQRRGPPASNSRGGREELGQVISVPSLSENTIFLYETKNKRICMGGVSRWARGGSSRCESITAHNFISLI